jgi:hypothetical protein
LSATLTCASCAVDFPAPAQRRGKVQIYCSPKCRVAGGNARRSSTRQGRINGETNPHAGRPVSPEATTIPPTAKPPVSGHASTAESVDGSRLEELMEKAHSRVGVNAFEIALIAKMRGISPWAPTRVILAR